MKRTNLRGRRPLEVKKKTCCFGGKLPHRRFNIISELEILNDQQRWTDEQRKMSKEIMLRRDFSHSDYLISS